MRTSFIYFILFLTFILVSSYLEDKSNIEAIIELQTDLDNLDIQSAPSFAVEL